MTGDVCHSHWELTLPFGFLAVLEAGFHDGKNIIRKGRP